MNLLNFLGEITTYSNFSLIGLADVVRLSCPPHEVVTCPPHSLNLYRLIYIHSGEIMYRADRETTALPAGSLLFLENTDEIRFRVGDTMLEAWIFYLHGNQLSYYKEAITNPRLLLPTGTPLFEDINRLIQIKKSGSIAEELLVTGHVTAILSSYLQDETFASGLPLATPPYLLSIKDEFVNNYSGDFSLDALSSKYKVSKYRLCREFAQYFGASPIKYLNSVRIQNARLLLVSTDLPVGEIAATVGIENVNHFIKLFKAGTGMTPLEYRQKLKA